MVAFLFAVSFFIVEPGIQSVTTDQSVLRGSIVKLRCSANGVPAPTVVWTKNGSDVVLIKGESTAILVLKNVNKQHHEGVYHCAVNNTEGGDDAAVSIKVVGKCPIAPEKFNVLDCETDEIACVANVIQPRLATSAKQRRDPCSVPPTPTPPTDSTITGNQCWRRDKYTFCLNFETCRFMF